MNNFDLLRVGKLCLRFDVPTTIQLLTVVFWVVKPCGRCSLKKDLDKLVGNPLYQDGVTTQNNKL